LLVPGTLGLTVLAWSRPSFTRQNPPTEACAEDTIGVASMEDDRTIILQLRAELPTGGHGHARLEYPASHPQYADVLSHVGELQPGETRCVPPWPDAAIGSEDRLTEA
jgi:hypothetical protein